MLAVFKKDFRAFFVTPIGFVFIGLFVCAMNYVFYSINIYQNNSDMGTTFSMVLIAMMLLCPLLTMRTFSEETKLRTDQLLLTAPVSVTSIVVGKFLSALCLYFLALLGTLTWPFVINNHGMFMPVTFFSNYTAVLFAGMAFISIGVFLSSLTESQVVAAVLTFITFGLIYLMSVLSSAVNVPVISAFLDAFSLFSRFNLFIVGLFPLSNIVYYFSVAFVFLFLTTRILEKKRWA